MTDQETAAPVTLTNAAVRNELWDSRHQVASLRLEIQRGDAAYAALGATLAAERVERDVLAAAHEVAVAERVMLVAELARVTTALHDNEVSRLTADGQAAQDRLAATEAATEIFNEALNDANERLARASAEREAILRTRTFRWTRHGRSIWRWVLARTH